MSLRLPFPVIPAMQPGLVVVILSLLLGLQPITTDLYLPALPGLTAGFGAPMAQAQLTLTALLPATGLSQLIWGPLSDQFSWRVAPFALAIFSALCLAVVALRFEETVTLMCRRLLPRVGVQRSVAIAGWLSLSGGSLMGVLALSGVPASGRRCIGAQRLFNHDGCFCHERLVLECPGRAGGLDAGAKAWQNR